MNIQNFDQRAYRNALGNYPTGVAVITAQSEGNEVASMVVGTFSSVSLDPPLISFMPRMGSRSFQKLQESNRFTINVLAFDQAETCSAIARRDQDFLGSIQWEHSDSGTIALPGVLATINCSFGDVIEAGDHYIVLGEVNGFTARRNVAPLVFFQGAYGGFSSRDANTCDVQLAEAVAAASKTTPAIGKLAETLNTETSVLARINEDFFTVGIAAHGPRLERLGERHPVVPPLGEFFVAWNKEEQQVWLDKIQDSEVRLMLESRLSRARERGWAVSLRNSYRSEEILSALRSYQEPFLAPALQREIEATIKQADKYYQDQELADQENYPVESIVVPVRDALGEVGYVLRANFDGTQLSGEMIMRNVDSMRATAQGLTADVYAGAYESTLV